MPTWGVFSRDNTSVGLCLAYMYAHVTYAYVRILRTFEKNGVCGVCQPATHTQIYHERTYTKNMWIHAAGWSVHAKCCATRRRRIGGCKTMHRNIRAPIDPVYQILSQAHGMMFICPRCFSWLAQVILSPTGEWQ